MSRAIRARLELLRGPAKRKQTDREQGIDRVGPQAPRSFIPQRNGYFKSFARRIIFVRGESMFVP